MSSDNAVAQAPHRQAARTAIEEARKAPFWINHYVLVVRQLPRLLQGHGLGQTLAYLQLRSTGKPNSPYDLIARQLDRWILTTLAVSARSALAALSSRDSRFYREASEQTWLFVRALLEGLEEGP